MTGVQSGYSPWPVGGAGAFDLIEVDLASAEETLNDRKYYTATALAFALTPTSFTLL